MFPTSIEKPIPFFQKQNDTKNNKLQTKNMQYKFTIDSAETSKFIGLATIKYAREIIKEFFWDDLPPQLVIPDVMQYVVIEMHLTLEPIIRY